MLFYTESKRPIPAAKSVTCWKLRKNQKYDILKTQKISLKKPDCEKQLKRTKGPKIECCFLFIFFWDGGLFVSVVFQRSDFLNPSQL